MPCNVKNSKQLPNCLTRADTNVLIVMMVSSVTSVLILLPFRTVVQHESGTKKSVTVYTKKISSQCSLTSQIEPVQNKIISWCFI